MPTHSGSTPNSLARERTTLSARWASSLSGGTRISAALALARQVLHADRVTDGSVVLVSDLGDSPNDRAALSAAVVGYVRDGIPLRVLGIHPTPDRPHTLGGPM